MYGFTCCPAPRGGRVSVPVVAVPVSVPVSGSPRVASRSAWVSFWFRAGISVAPRGARSAFRGGGGPLGGENVDARGVLGGRLGRGLAPGSVPRVDQFEAQTCPGEGRRRHGCRGPCPALRSLSAWTRTSTPSESPTHSGAVAPSDAAGGALGGVRVGRVSSLCVSTSCQPDQVPVPAARVRTWTRPCSSVSGSSQMTPTREKCRTSRAGQALVRAGRGGGGRVRSAEGGRGGRGAATGCCRGLPRSTPVSTAAAGRRVLAASRGRAGERQGEGGRAGDADRGSKKSTHAPDLGHSHTKSVHPGTDGPSATLAPNRWCRAAGVGPAPAYACVRVNATDRTPADLLRSALAADPGRPLVTFYDDATGERVELSVATFANWVAKTAEPPPGRPRRRARGPGRAAAARALADGGVAAGVRVGGGGRGRRRGSGGGRRGGERARTRWRRRGPVPGSGSRWRCGRWAGGSRSRRPGSSTTPSRCRRRATGSCRSRRWIRRSPRWSSPGGSSAGRRSSSGPGRRRGSVSRDPGRAVGAVVRHVGGVECGVCTRRSRPGGPWCCAATWTSWARRRWPSGSRASGFRLLAADAACLECRGAGRLWLVAPTRRSRMIDTAPRPLVESTSPGQSARTANPSPPASTPWS